MTMNDNNNNQGSSQHDEITHWLVDNKYNIIEILSGSKKISEDIAGEIWERSVSGIRYIDLIIYTPKILFCFEVKPRLPSTENVMRQINGYRDKSESIISIVYNIYLKHEFGSGGARYGNEFITDKSINFVLASPDDRDFETFRGQGILCIKYEPFLFIKKETNKEPLMSRQDLIDSLTEEDIEKIRNRMKLCSTT